MKRFDGYFFYFLSVALLYIATSGLPSFDHATTAKDYAQHPTREQRASHMIQMYDRYDKRDGQCSATAIGAHALLTAEHCIEKDKDFKVSIDLAVEKHNIVAAKSDGRDHLLVLLDGSPFTNIEYVKQDAAAKVGEAAVFYGDREGKYPPEPQHGVVNNCYDPSDVDMDAGIVCFSMEAIPGDSGSAIYDSNGNIVGIVTYRTDEHTSTGFALSFNPRDLAIAREFDGKNTSRIASAPKQEDINDHMKMFFGGLN